MVAQAGARAFLVLALLAAGLTGKLLGAPEDYEGKPVTRILFDPALQPLPDEELFQMLPVKAGAPLHLAAVRDAIVRLFATGRYRDITADAELADGGVVLRFLTRTTWFIGRVRVEGVPAPPNEGQLINATKLQLGREYTEEGAQAAIRNIEAVLRANGFYEAKVERFLDYEPAFAQVNVLFLVDPGPRARLARPVVKGATGKAAKKIVSATHWERFWFLKGWKTATDRRVQRGLERIRRSYQRQDYLLNSITLEAMNYDSQSQRVVPVLRVEPGPQVSVETIGAKLSRGRLKRLVPIYQEQSVDRDLLVEGARNLREHFQGQGYFDAAVEFQVRQDSDSRETIEYSIQPGRRYKLVHLEIRGNRYFDDATIRERLRITPASRIRYRHGRYSKALLDGDLAAIADLYRSNGFRDVKVSARTQTPYRNAADAVAVFIEIEEGPQWRVAALQLDGVSPEHEAQIRSLIGSLAGQPFSEANVAVDRDNVLDFYYNNGYPDATFNWTAEQQKGRAEVKLHITVHEGSQRYVRACLIGGLQQTDPDLVYSRILLKPGDPLSQSRMVESQRRLYDLGVFARVTQAIQNPDGLEERKYVLHQFEEARKYSVNFGLGAQIARIGRGFTDFENPAGAAGFSPRVSFGISRANMFGVAHTASLQSRVSETRQRALVNYFAPQFKGRANLSLTFTGLYDFSKDINTFKNTRWEGSVQMRQRLSRANSFQYRFTYRRVSTKDIRISPELVPIFARSVRVGLVAGGFIQDKRDDPLDSTRGFYNAIEASVASRFLGSQTNYLRLIGRNSTYHRVRKNLVLARSLTLGWLINTASDKQQRPIPLPERIFSGGASSHRGFPDNQAGPRDLETGFVLGGRALLMHNLELRFPLLGDTVSGVLFHDAGNVYSKMSNLSFRFRQRNKQDFDYMVQTFGFGIRYRTPIGPVRLDLAFSPNPPRFFGFRGSREDLIGGTGQKTDQRISRFQFFFSIGQTF